MGRVFDTDNNMISDRVDATVTDPALKLAPQPTSETHQNIFGQDPTVSSELLYFFLNDSESLGSSEAISDQFTTSEIADTDNDGLLEFVDAWGNPLRFYRWPTRMIDIDPPAPPAVAEGFQPVLSNVNDPTDVFISIDHDNDDSTAPVTAGTRVITANERLVANIMLKGLPPAPTNLPNGAIPRDLLLVDPDDPVGVLYRALEEYDGDRDINGDGDTDDPGEQSTPLRVEFNETDYHTPDTYHVPLIVSAGPDQALGIFEPTDNTNFGNLAAYNIANLDSISDNLTNRNKRAGGR